MATKKQIAANRRNAKRSTGPKTPAGKAVSCMNNLRHGLRARTIVLPGEEPQEYDLIKDGLQDLYQPQNQAEQYLVDQAAIAQWKLIRAEAYGSNCLMHATTDELRFSLLAKNTTVTSRLERAYFKAYKELERIKAARPKPAPAVAEPLAAGSPAAAETAPPPDPPAEAEEENQNGKYDMPDDCDVFWYNPETGVRDYFVRRRNGVNHVYENGVLLPKIGGEPDDDSEVTNLPEDTGWGRGIPDPEEND